MAYYADPQTDLPSPWKPKRVIFYAAGLKVYGQIPYILQRRLQAEFISNSAPGIFGGRILAPTGEVNYTIVPRRRADGRPHGAAAVQQLLDWLMSDAGFEWGVAVPGEYERGDLRLPNWWNEEPITFVPGADGGREKLLILLGG